MLRLAVAGAGGRMGTIVLDLALRDPRFQAVAALTVADDPRLGENPTTCAATGGTPEFLLTTDLVVPCDVLIDFSLPAGTAHWAAQCRARRIPFVTGVTGLTDDIRRELNRAAEVIPLFSAANFSIGVTVVARFVEQLAGALGPEWDIEIVETHHRQKVDAPSGTARRLLDAAQRGRQSTGGRGAAPSPSPVIHGRSGATGPRPAGQIAVHAVRLGSVVGTHEVHFGTGGERITVTHEALDRTAFAAGALAAAAWIVGRPPGMYTMEDLLAQPAAQARAERSGTTP
jgi:4-hydroxy-tetrahydrodipicolinate reductase